MIRGPAQIPGRATLLHRANAFLHDYQAAFHHPGLAAQLTAGRNARPAPSGIQIAASPLVAAARHRATLGISDEWLADYVCAPYGPPPVGGTYPPSTCGADREQPALSVFVSHRAVRYSRIIIGYDTILGYDARSDSCTITSETTGGPEASTIGLWQALGDYLIASRRAGLSPTIAFGVAHPGDADSDPVTPAMTRPAQSDAYVCGVAGIMLWTTAVGYPVHQWEPWNEPDEPQNEAFPNGTAAQNAQNAATMFSDAELASTYAGARGDTLAAGTLSHYRADWDGDYAAALRAHDIWPTVWSIHDYADPQSSLTCTPGGSGCSTATIDDLRDLVDSAYATGDRTDPDYWITETGVQLQPDAAHGPLHYVSTATPRGKRAAQLQEQANAAEDVNVLAAHERQVTEVFQYGLGTVSTPSFDSAPTDSDGVDPPDGTVVVAGAQSLLRPAYCVIALNAPPAGLGRDSVCDDPGGNQQ